MNDGLSEVKEDICGDFDRFLLGKPKACRHHKIIEVISRGKVPAASTEDDELDPIIIIGLFDFVGELAVHVKSKSIVPLGAIEGYPQSVALELR